MHKNAQKFMSEKLGAKFPTTILGYSMVKIARLDYAFSEVSPVEGQSLSQI